MDLKTSDHVDVLFRICLPTYTRPLTSVTLVLRKRRNAASWIPRVRMLEPLEHSNLSSGGFKAPGNSKRSTYGIPICILWTQYNDKWSFHDGNNSWKSFFVLSYTRVIDQFCRWWHFEMTCMYPVWYYK